MRRAFMLVYSPKKSAALRLIPVFILIYMILLPAQLSVLQTQDTEQAARDFYSRAQVFLSAAAIWPLFIYFFPVWQHQSRELMLSLHHPDNACAFILWAEHQLLTVPAYIVYAAVFPGQKEMIILLLVQSVSVTLLWLTFLFLFRSSLICSAVVLAYIAALAMAGNIQVPVMIAMNSLWHELPAGYFPARIMVTAAECLILEILYVHRSDRV